jgi:hypothetical protein
MPAVARVPAMPLAAQFSPEQLAQIRALVRDELAAQRSTLSRVDAEALSRVLPAIVGVLGSDGFLAREAVRFDAVQLVVPGWKAERLGRLLKTATGIVVDGLMVQRIGEEAHAIVWQIVGVPDLEGSGRSSATPVPRRRGASSTAEDTI